MQNVTAVCTMSLLCALCTCTCWGVHLKEFLHLLCTWLAPAVCTPWGSEPKDRTYCGSHLVWFALRIAPALSMARTYCGSHLVWFALSMVCTCCGLHSVWFSIINHTKCDASHTECAISSAHTSDILHSIRAS